MPSPLSLSHAYELPTEGYLGLRVLGIGPDEAVAFYEYGNGKEGAVVLLHLRSGDVQRHELAIPGELLVDGRLGRAPILMKAAGQLFFFLNPQLLYRVDSSARVLQEIRIDSPAEVDHQPERFTGFSDTNIIPVFFSGNRVLSAGATIGMALLEIDVARSYATWRRMGDRVLFSLPREAFPSSGAADSPYVHHAAYRDGLLHTYTIGSNASYIKWGMDFCGLSVFDNRLELREHLFLERGEAYSPKKFGRFGWFASSLEYCIVTPGYPTSDPWKRNQRLFSMSDRRFHEIKLPSGFTKHQVMEHFHATFWLLRREPDGFKVASCRFAAP